MAPDEAVIVLLIEDVFFITAFITKTHYSSI